SVYLEDHITSAQRSAIEGTLTSGQMVVAHEYVSKNDALKRFKQTFGDLSVAIDSLGDNPLPASYEVRLRAEPDAGTGVERLSATLQQMAGVSDVRYDRQWLDRLRSAIQVIREVGLLLG